MNGAEIARVIALLETTYGSKMKSNQPAELQVEVWTTALSDIPWTPYGANALDWWIKREEWPPTPADIRNRAKREMAHERQAEAGTAMLGMYGILPGVTPASLESAEAVMEIVGAWERGDLPIAGVLTTCTGYDRFQTLLAVDRATKKRVIALCDAIERERIEQEGGTICHQGTFEREDLESGAARVIYHEGRKVVQFASSIYSHGTVVHRPIPERRITWDN